MESIRTNIDRAIEPIGHVNRIANGNQRGIDLIGPDLKPLEHCLAIDGGKGAVDRVEALRDLDAPDAGNVESGVEGAPMLAEKNFEIGVEIHRRAGIEPADVGKMPRHIARGKIEGTAEGHADMGKIAADPEALADDLGGGDVRAARAEAILDVLMNPVADGLDTRQSIFDVAELLPREIEQLVGIAVAAGQRVAERLGREAVDRNGWAGKFLIIGQRRNGDKRVVMNDIFARLQNGAVREIAVRILIIIAGEMRSEGHLLLQDKLVAVVMRFHDEQKGGWRGSFVDDMATDADREIEGKIIHEERVERQEPDTVLWKETSRILFPDISTFIDPGAHREHFVAMAAVSIDYVFRVEEKAGDGVRRILGEMARQGKNVVRQSQRSPDESIHAARLIIKRMRALLWFAKPALGTKVYAKARTQLRKAASLMAARRDLTVMQATLDKLAQDAEKPKDLMAATQILRSLARESAEATKPKKALRQTLAKSMEILCRSAREAGKCAVTRSKWPTAAKQLKKAFRATHQAGKKAQRTVDDTDYHEWRKKAKRLLYQLELTQIECDPAKARIVKLVEKLQQTLGDHHDAAVAANYFRKAVDPSSSVKRVLRLLKKRQSHLRKQANRIASDF